MRRLTMKTRRNVGLAIAALALVAIIAGTANAQQAITKNAHFTLPFRAMWADTVLSPGQYTLSVVRRGEDRDMLYTVTFAGAGKRETILALRPLDRPPVAKSSMLVVEGRGDIHIIHALHLPSADLVLTFPESKTERELAAKGPETMQSVPILVATK
jgi:hypothetical protein